MAERTPVAIRIRHGHREASELRGEGRAEKLQRRSLERAVAKPVICAFENEHARLTAVQHRGFQSRLDRVGTGIAEDHLSAPRAPAPEGQLAEPFAQFDFAFRRMHVAHRME